MNDLLSKLNFEYHLIIENIYCLNRKEKLIKSKDYNLYFNSFIKKYDLNSIKCINSEILYTIYKFYLLKFVIYEMNINDKNENLFINNTINKIIHYLKSMKYWNEKQNNYFDRYIEYIYQSLNVDTREKEKIFKNEKFKEIKNIILNLKIDDINISNINEYLYFDLDLINKYSSIYNELFYYVINKTLWICYKENINEIDTYNSLDKIIDSFTNCFILNKKDLINKKLKLEYYKLIEF